MNLQENISKTSEFSAKHPENLSSLFKIYEKNERNINTYKIILRFGIAILVIVYIILLFSVCRFAFLKNEEMEYTNLDLYVLKKNFEDLSYKYNGILDEVRQLEGNVRRVQQQLEHVKYEDAESVNVINSIKTLKKREIVDSAIDGVSSIVGASSIVEPHLVSTIIETKINVHSRGERLAHFDNSKERNSNFMTVPGTSNPIMTILQNHSPRLSSTDKLVKTTIDSQRQPHTERTLSRDKEIKEEERKIVKKSLKGVSSENLQEPSDLIETAGRTGRKKHDDRQELRRRRNGDSQLRGTHFHGHFHHSIDGHTDHSGNVMLSWSEAGWVEESVLSYDNHSGEFTVKESGVYHIYAQVYYAHVQDKCGYSIEKRSRRNGGVGSGPIAFCILTDSLYTHSSHIDETRENTCYTAATDYLEKGDKLFLKQQHRRNSVFKEGRSFFGVFRLK